MNSKKTFPMLQEKLAHFQIILGSGSPRRKSLLKELRLDFTVELMPVDEAFSSSLQKEEITNYLVKLKADGFRKLKDNEVLITGDTIVWHNNRALNKPQNKAEAMQMLQSLSGTTHQVISSVALTSKEKQIIKSDEVDVSFRELTLEEIEFYVDQFKPFDKAGAYGIQEWIGKIGITSIQGSFYTVMGLPVHLLYDALLEITEK
ncbi:Maf family nucleotide pyrophosphatase [Psychroflexus planctonicus]|nr:Maf family nucleotide pyrophosphatase [Psychroflexus planctonicus]